LYFRLTGCKSVHLKKSIKPRKLSKQIFCRDFYLFYLAFLKKVIIIIFKTTSKNFYFRNSKSLSTFKNEEGVNER
jgi:hypothetical protein